MIQPHQIITENLPITQDESIQQQNIYRIYHACSHDTGYSLRRQIRLQGRGLYSRRSYRYVSHRGLLGIHPALKSRASGDAIKSINSLWVLLFDTEGDLVEKHEITKDKFSLEENDRPDGTPSSEVQTGRAKFNLTLPNGKWRIYAVANHDLSGFEGNMQQLQKIKLTWQDDVALNAQMFGFFTNSDGQSAADMPASDVDDFNPDGSVSGTSFTAPVVVVAPASPLHAWVRRAASKLTVAFNTDKLKDNVRIYIKSIAIKDIAKECYLGFQNCPAATHSVPPRASATT